MGPLLHEVDLLLDFDRGDWHVPLPLAATAAATDPRIEAVTMFAVARSDSEAYASRASPAPMGSTGRSTKLSTMKNSRGIWPGRAISKDPALSQLQDQVSATRPPEQLQRQRTDHGVLVGQRKACLALIGREEIEVREVKDVAPAVRDLTVGYLQRFSGERLLEPTDRLSVEDAVAEVAEDDDLAPRRLASRSSGTSRARSETGRLSTRST